MLKRNYEEPSIGLNQKDIFSPDLVSEFSFAPERGVDFSGALLPAIHETNQSDSAEEELKEYLQFVNDSQMEFHQRFFGDGSEDTPVKLRAELVPIVHGSGREQQKVLRSISSDFLHFSSESIFHTLGYTDSEKHKQQRERIIRILATYAVAPFHQDLMFLIDDEARKELETSQHLWTETLEEDWHPRSKTLHTAYATGVIWRAVEGIQDAQVQGQPLTKDRLEAFMTAIHDQDFDSEESALQALYDMLGFTGDQQAQLEEFFAPENYQRWLLDGLRPEDEVTVAINLAGYYASRATVMFAREVLSTDADQALDQLESLFNLPEQELFRIAVNPQTEQEQQQAQIILFGVQTANLTWIMYKPYQAVAEEQAGVPENKKDKKGFGRLKNKYFATFGSMSQSKGWPAVLIDKDQIEAGVTWLKAHWEEVKWGNL